MNSLQGVSKKKNYFVSINAFPDSIAKDKLIKEIEYEHPLFDLAAIDAQKELHSLNHNGPLYYCGSYFNEVYGNMSVVQEAGELKMKFSHHPNMYAKLEAFGGSRFYATFNDPTFSKAVFPFTVTGNKVTGATVKVADFVEYNPYEFKKIK